MCPGESRRRSWVVPFRMEAGVRLDRGVLAVEQLDKLLVGAPSFRACHRAGGRRATPLSALLAICGHEGGSRGASRACEGRSGGMRACEAAVLIKDGGHGPVVDCSQAAD